MQQTVQDYVDRIEAKISWYRDRASKLIGWGRFINGPFAILFYVVGAIAIITGVLKRLVSRPIVWKADLPLVAVVHPRLSDHLDVHELDRPLNAGRSSVSRHLRIPDVDY